MLFLRSLLDDVLPAGFTLADLHALSVEFARYGSKSIDRLAFEPSSGRSLSVQDGAEAVEKMVGGYKSVEAELIRAVEWPTTGAADMHKFGIRPARGILLHGSPRCSIKTTLAQNGRSFFALTGADAYSPYVGNTKRKLGEVYAQARLAMPAVVFLDEMDALVGKRSLEGEQDSKGNAAGGVQLRILSTLLSEMDGLENAERSEVRNFLF